MSWHEFFKSPAGGILCFWLGWFSTGGLAACISGWPRLARRFAARPVVGEGARFRFASGFIGGWRGIPISFRWCLGLVIVPEGIAFSVLLPWRFLQPPFFLPWSAVVSAERTRFMLADHTVFTLQDESVRIRVSGRAGQLLMEAWHRRMTTEEATIVSATEVVLPAIPS